MIRPFQGKDVSPHYATCIDIETAPNGDVIGVGFAWGEQRQYKSFENLDDWYHFYCSLLYSNRKYKELHKRLTRVYAHNGANFDYLSFYTYFADKEEMLEGQYITADSAGIGVIAKLKRANTVVTFLDSYRLLPQSLAKLGETFNANVQKQVVPPDCKNNYLKFKEKYPDMFWSYLRSDVLSIQEIIHSFWGTIYELFGNVGFLPMTLPALVLRIFTKQITEDIFTPHYDKLKQLERDAYKGGLTLCLKTGTFDNVNVYDVNSMYPSVMLTEEYPVSYMGYWSNEYDKTSMGLWRGTFNQSRQDLPPILFDHKNGATYSGSGVYTTNELNYLTSIGGTFTITEGYVYTKTAPLFTRFIDKLYSLRKEAIENGNDSLSYILKIMMNSLYGKFAQREDTDKIVLGKASEMVSMIDQGILFKILGDWFIIPEHREVQHCFVAIATMITANARIDLHRRMTSVINQGNDVYYCDTDSIHTNGEYQTSNDLGGIKLENQGEAAYAGKKIYAFKGGKTRAKGIGRKITKGELSYEVVAEIAHDKTKTVPITFEHFPSVKGVLGKKQNAAVITEMTRTLRNTGGIWDNE